MAKRKKHKKSKQQRKQLLQSEPQTAVPVVSSDKPEAEEKVITPSLTTKPALAEAGSAAEASYVKQDVRYGLILVGIIVLAFVALYLLLQNPTVSAKIYGIIKLPNVGN